MDERKIKLTLGQGPQAPKLVQETPREEKFKDIHLTPGEERQVEEFTERIDLSNTATTLEYGAGAQEQIAQFFEEILKTIRTKDLGEAGDLISSVVLELKNFDQGEKKGLAGLFQKSKNKVDGLETKYNKAQADVDQIARSLEDHQTQLLKDISTLNQMYGLNLSCYKGLTMYTQTGEKRLEKVKVQELPVLETKTLESKLPIDAQEVQDFRSSIDRFEKKLHDLGLTRVVSLQMAPQIRLVQSRDTVIVEKLQSTIINTIPLWKGQMILALGALRTGRTAQAQKEVTDLTDDLLKKNAETLEMSSIETAKASRRVIADIGTIKYTNNQLIAAIQEVRQISRGGAAQRAQANVQLQELEKELKHGFLDVTQDK